MIIKASFHIQVIYKNFKIFKTSIKNKVLTYINKIIFNKKNPKIKKKNREYYHKAIKKYLRRSLI